MSQTPEQEIVERLTKLKAKRENIVQRNFKVNAELESARKTLRSLRSDAKERFGTSDLEELKQLLITKRKDNKESVDKFDSDLAKIDELISAIEKSIQSLSAE